MGYFENFDNEPLKRSKIENFYKCVLLLIDWCSFNIIIVW
jgi:hypothetical protein